MPKQELYFPSNPFWRSFRVGVEKGVYRCKMVGRFSSTEVSGKNLKELLEHAFLVGFKRGMQKVNKK